MKWLLAMCVALCAGGVPADLVPRPAKARVAPAPVRSLVAPVPVALAWEAVPEATGYCVGFSRSPWTVPCDAWLGPVWTNAYTGELPAGMRWVQVVTLRENEGSEPSAPLDLTQVQLLVLTQTPGGPWTEVTRLTVPATNAMQIFKLEMR